MRTRQQRQKTVLQSIKCKSKKIHSANSHDLKQLILQILYGQMQVNKLQTHNILTCNAIPIITLDAYLDRIVMFLWANDANTTTYLVHCIVLLKRYIQCTRYENSINPWSAHTVLFCCAIAAYNMQADRLCGDWKYHSDVGGVSSRELEHKFMYFFKLMDWRLSISISEYNEVVRWIQRIYLL